MLVDIPALTRVVHGLSTTSQTTTHQINRPIGDAGERILIVAAKTGFEQQITCTNPTVTRIAHVISQLNSTTAITLALFETELDPDVITYNLEARNINGDLSSGKWAVVSMIPTGVGSAPWVFNTFASGINGGSPHHIPGITPVADGALVLHLAAARASSASDWTDPANPDITRAFKHSSVGAGSAVVGAWLQPIGTRRDTGSLSVPFNSGGSYATLSIAFDRPLAPHELRIGGGLGMSLGGHKEARGSSVISDHGEATLGGKTAHHGGFHIVSLGGEAGDITFEGTRWLRHELVITGGGDLNFTGTGPSEIYRSGLHYYNHDLNEWVPISIVPVPDAE